MQGLQQIFEAMMIVGGILYVATTYYENQEYKREQEREERKYQLELHEIQRESAYADKQHREYVGKRMLEVYEYCKASGDSDQETLRCLKVIFSDEIKAGIPLPAVVNELPLMIMKNVLLAAYEEKSPSWHVPVFIVNTNSEPIDLILGQHSIQSEENSVLDLGASKDKSITIPPNAALEIDRMNDEGELDFLTEYWVKHEDKQYLASVSGTSLYLSPRSNLQIPIINKVGYVEYFAK